MKEVTVKNTVEVTQEEKTIVLKLSKGEKAENIGKYLGHPAGTFATMLRDIRLKYGCANSVELVAYFLRQGIIN